MLERLWVDSPVYWTWALGAVFVLSSLAVTAHVLLTKRSSRSAAGWVALIWLSPLLGSLIYLFLGINRVHRKALKLREELPQRQQLMGHLETHNIGDASHADPIERFMNSFTVCPTTYGNQVRLLNSGEEAFPAMLAAIDQAEVSVSLMTFIFDRDEWGLRFVEALSRAKQRGVEVRLLIDGVGTWFSFPPVLFALRRAGVPYRRFLTGLSPKRFALINLRNHRKVMVVDGQLGFTGGMNIRGSFVKTDEQPHQADRDLHFEVRGPAVAWLQEAFAEDWCFTTGEQLQGETWFPVHEPVGDMAVRVIPDGPDGSDWGKASLTFLAGLACAQRSVKIMTPYFVPDEEVELAIGTASRRGVEVDIIVPWDTNQPLTQYAMMANMHWILPHGCRIWLKEGAFDHSKLMIVDDRWCVVGSANWDPRSLRLNFELLVTVHSVALASDLNAVFEARLRESLPLTSQTLEGRSWVRRVRDGAIRLFSPYL